MNAYPQVFIHAYLYTHSSIYNHRMKSFVSTHACSHTIHKNSTYIHTVRTYILYIHTYMYILVRKLETHNAKSCDSQVILESEFDQDWKISCNKSFIAARYDDEDVDDGTPPAQHVS